MQNQLDQRAKPRPLTIERDGRCQTCIWQDATTGNVLHLHTPGQSRFALLSFFQLSATPSSLAYCGASQTSNRPCQEAIPLRKGFLLRHTPQDIVRSAWVRLRSDPNLPLG